MIFRHLLFIMVLIFLSAAMAAPASPCSCWPPPTVEDALNMSSAVFLGTVTATHTEGEGDLSFVVVDFLVEGMWKGAVTRDYSIATPATDAACGITFLVGVEYVVYAAEDSGWGFDTVLLIAGLCGRTTESQYAETDLAELGPYTPLPVRAATWGLLKSRYSSPETTS